MFSKKPVCPSMHSYWWVRWSFFGFVSYLFFSIVDKVFFHIPHVCIQISRVGTELICGLKVSHKKIGQCFPGSSAGKEFTCNAGNPSSIPGLGRSTGENDRLPTPLFLGFPGGLAGKESTCNVGYLGSIPRLERSPGEGNGYPLQYSSLENSMDCIVHGVTQSLKWLSNFHFHFMEKNDKNIQEMQIKTR